jgi:L-ascorbate metabolism protein UlaG (beta-lactamase superfamily)
MGGRYRIAIRAESRMNPAQCIDMHYGSVPTTEDTEDMEFKKTRMARPRVEAAD